jgi:hypothetical protein
MKRCRLLFLLVLLLCGCVPGVLEPLPTLAPTLAPISTAVPTPAPPTPTPTPASYMEAVASLLEEWHAASEAIVNLMLLADEDINLIYTELWGNEFKGAAVNLVAVTEKAQELPTPPPEFSDLHDQLMVAAGHLNFAGEMFIVWAMNPINENMMRLAVENFHLGCEAIPEAPAPRRR